MKSKIRMLYFQAQRQNKSEKPTNCWLVNAWTLRSTTAKLQVLMIPWSLPHDLICNFWHNVCYDSIFILFLFTVILKLRFAFLVKGGVLLLIYIWLIGQVPDNAKCLMIAIMDIGSISILYAGANRKFWTLHKNSALFIFSSKSLDQRFTIGSHLFQNNAVKNHHHEHKAFNTIKIYHVQK